MSDPTIHGPPEQQPLIEGKELPKEKTKIGRIIASIKNGQKTEVVPLAKLKEIFKKAPGSSLTQLVDACSDAIRGVHKKIADSRATAKLKAALNHLNELKKAAVQEVKRRIDETGTHLGTNRIHLPTPNMAPLKKKVQSLFPPKEEALESTPVLFNKETGKPPETRDAIDSNPYTIGGTTVGWEKATPLSTRERTKASCEKMGRRELAEGLEQRPQDWVATVDVHHLSEKKQVEMTNCFRYAVTADEKGEEEKFGFLRLGVICDHTNEFTDLEELTTNPDGCRQKAKNIGLLLGQDDEARRAGRRIFTDEQKKTLERCKMELENPEETAKTREAALEMQMLDYLARQVEYNASAIDKTGRLCVVHEGLLRENKGRVGMVDTLSWLPDFEPTGWMHSEGHEIADMKFTFDRINGQEIVFEEDPPAFIDKDGVFHLPAPKGIVPGRTVNVSSALINVSVQGEDKKAVKWQRDISRAGIDSVDTMIAGINDQLTTLKEEREEATKNGQYETLLGIEREIEKIETGMKLFDRWRKRFEKGKSSYPLAKELCTACCLLGIPVSTGCMGNKDRTGVVASQAAARLVQVEQEIEARVQKKMAAIDTTKAREYTKEAKEARKRSRGMEPFFWRCFYPGSIAKTIARMNANQRCLKTMKSPDVSYPPSIPLVAGNAIMAAVKALRVKMK